MKASLRAICSALFAVIMPMSALASTETIGDVGIMSAGLRTADGMPLNGAGVSIGQVEDYRPSNPGLDTDPTYLNSFVDPAQVFWRHTQMPGTPLPPPNFDATANTASEMDEVIRPHAVWVAGIMISTDTSNPDMDGDSPTGVAPGASLYSAGYNLTTVLIGSDAAVALTAQHLATTSNVRATNLSFAIPQTTSTLDGSQLLTQFVDWSAATHDVLYVIAGNEINETNAVPTDEFNGMTVAASAKFNGVFSRVDLLNRYNQDANGDFRSSIDILAPGSSVKVTGYAKATDSRSGTSYAAPHVTATAALLQQYANERIAHVGSPGWKSSPGGGQLAPSQRHEVMKAVIMNSADKLIDNGTLPIGNPAPQGGLLGMTRTVYKQDGVSTWLNSIAYNDSVQEGGGAYPLDEEMGVGHLNARRAVQQFAPGEYDSDSGDVPTIGWDYGTTTGMGDINKYPLTGTLTAKHFISVTLAWDRIVKLQSDNGTTNQYDVGDTFTTTASTFPDDDNDDLINSLDIF